MSIVRTQGGVGTDHRTLLLILPATQAAVELMNYLVTTVLTPHGFQNSIFQRRRSFLRNDGRDPDASYQ